GRSVVEAAAEARVLVTHKIQLAAFADSGAVYETARPAFNEKLFIGVGGGVRYISAVGPIRFDVAVPMDRRPNDRAFQIYISLGQAF
ncbi:MAG TPA: BamA/TamA family outer membrane protein, partial [Parvularculaceae bacterium]|nr:BamA/TamA family outer membrane protein [Parvularculaceae bacterium]